ncbi:MAG: transposase [Deltaproteobacteria bacterium]|nr:transposase [Deltaproteobacteria bacterium]
MRTIRNRQILLYLKKNRKSQSEFKCLECGLEINADLNGAINMLDRGLKQLGLN